jgi:hypothetical protein
MRQVTDNMARLRRLLRRQDGITLIMAVGILGMLTLTGTTLIYYSNTNARSAQYSTTSSSAYDLAEAGMNEMMAVLSKPENNALMPGLLPSTTHTYPGGTVTWSGTLNQLTQTWSLTSTGSIKNPTGNASQVQRTLTAKVPVTPTLTQPLNNPAWNYIYATKTGSPCDMTIANNVSGSSRMYVEGNLCLSNNVTISQTSLLVKGNLDLSNNAAVGASTSMSTRVETYVGGNCRYGGGSWATPCSGNQDSRRIYSKMNGPSWVVGVNTAVPVIAAPAANWADWYANSIPGPALDCTTSNGARSGVPPVWDNDGVRNNSVATIFELTPAASYTCRVGPAATPSGELSWNATTKTLTVYGTMFIDGSAKVTNGALNQYNGQATIYLSGTLLMGNSTKLCGGISGSNCDFAAWNPNTEMLTFVANGNGGQAGTGNSILLDNNTQFQGGVFATKNVTYSNNSRSDGPIVGEQIIFSNNVQNDQFPTITTVPVGMPGNPAVYAQPNPPQLYSG